MKTILFLALLLSACLSLHIPSHQTAQKQSFNHQKGQFIHHQECQLCSICQAVSGGSYDCKKCSYGEKVDGKCPTNSTIANCIFDYEGYCSSCRSGYSVNSETGQCQACSIQNCSYCSYSRDTCDYCNNRFQKIQGKCQACSPNCLYCYQEQCYRCANGFGLNQTMTCFDCEVQNCQNCSSPGNCDSCVNGFGLQGKKCVQCPENCASCFNGTCNYCNYGFAVSDNSQCVECNISGCSSCDEPNHCVSCYWGNVSDDGSSCSWDFHRVTTKQEHRRK